MSRWKEPWTVSRPSRTCAPAASFSPPSVERGPSPAFPTPLRWTSAVPTNSSGCGTRNGIDLLRHRDVSVVGSRREQGAAFPALEDQIRVDERNLVASREFVENQAL